MTTETTDAPEVTAPPADTLDIPEPRPAPDSVPATPRVRLPRRRRTTPGASEKAKPASSSASKSRPATRRSKAPKIGEGMAALYATLGVAASAIPSKPSKLNPELSAMHLLGQTVVANSAACGAAWEKAADEDPRIAAALERVLVASAFGELFAAHLPILLVAGVNVGAVPPEVAAMLAAASSSSEG